MAAKEPQVIDAQEFIDILDYQFQGDSDTVQRKRLVVENFREEGSIYHAALSSRVGRKTVYRWIENDPQFAQAIEDSKEDCYDKVETSVYRKALNGDSLLMMFYLKAHRHKFRDKVTIDVESVRQEIQERMAQLGLEQAPIAGYLNGSYPGPGPKFNSGSQFSQPVQQLESQTGESQKEE